MLRELSLAFPMFICGFPSFAQIGKITCQLIVDFVQGELFAEYYSPYFPDQIAVEKNGLCRLLGYELHGSAVSKPNIVVVTGDAHITVDEPPAYYTVLSEIAEFASNLKAKRMVVVDGIRLDVRAAGRIYAAATSVAGARNLKKHGAELLRNAELPSPLGLLLGLSKLRKIEGAGIFGAVGGPRSEKEIAQSLFEFIIRAFSIKRD